MADYSSQATFQNALESEVLPLINVLVNRHTPGWDSVDKTGQTIGADKIEVALQVGENRAGVGFRKPTERHPYAGSVRIERLQIESTDLIGALGITGHLMRGTKGAANAVADAFEVESKSIMGSFKDALERSFFASNGTGRLATVISSATVGGVTEVEIDKLGMLYVTEGESIQFLDAAAGTDTILSAPSYIITSVSYTGNNKIKLDKVAAPAITNGYGVYVNGSKDRDFMGMSGAIGDNTHVPGGIFQGKDRATSQYYSATVLNDLVDTVEPIDITQGMFTTADLGKIRDIMEFQKKQRPDCFWTTIPISNAYRDECGEKVQYVNAQVIDAEIKVPAYDNIPIRKSLYVPYGTIFGLVQNSFKFHPLATGTQIIEFIGQGQDGLTLRKREGYDIYDSYLILRGQIGWNNPWANVRYYCDNPALATTV